MKQITLDEFIDIMKGNEKFSTIKKDYIKNLISIAAEEGYEITSTKLLDDDVLDGVLGGVKRPGVGKPGKVGYR